MYREEERKWKDEKVEVETNVFSHLYKIESIKFKHLVQFLIDVKKIRLPMCYICGQLFPLNNIN